MRRTLWVSIIMLIILVVAGVQVVNRLPLQDNLFRRIATSPQPTLPHLPMLGVMWPARIVASPDGKWIAVLYRSRNEVSEDIHHRRASLTQLAWGSQKEYSISFRSEHFRLAAHIMREGYPFVRHTFSPDKSRVATFGGDDKRVAIWGTRSKRLLAVLGEHPSPVTTVSISGHQDLVCTGTEGGGAYVWNMVRNELLCRVRAHRGKVTAVAISADGSLLATAGDDASLKVWKVRTGRLLWRSRRLHKPVVALAFSPDGNLLLASTADGEAVLWEAVRGNQMQRIDWRFPVKGLVQSAGFSEDGRQAQIALEQEYICLWNLSESKLQGVIEDIGAPVHSMTFTPEGNYLLAGDEEGTIHVWQTASMGKEAVIRAGRACVTALATSNDGKYLLAGSADGKVRMWNWSELGSVSVLFAPFVGRVQYAAFTPDDQRFICCSADGEVVLCDMQGREIVRVNNQGELQIAAISPDGSLLATQRSEAITVWRISSMDIQPVIELRSDRLADTLAFSPDNSRLFVGWRGQIDVYRTGDGGWESSRQNARRFSFYCALFPEHDVVVDGVDSTELDITSLRSGRLIARLEYVGGDIGWLIASANGYYTCPEQARPHITWRVGDNIERTLRRDPLAYYRPEAVRRALRTVYGPEHNR